MNLYSVSKNEDINENALTFGVLDILYNAMKTLIHIVLIYIYILI